VNEHSHTTTMQPLGRAEDITIAVLAGGRSTRIGRDKSFIQLGGKPLIRHVLDQVLTFNVPVIIIANEAGPYAQFNLPVYGDVLPQRSSLVGLHSALTISGTPHTLCVACDMPLLNRDLLGYLISLRHEADIVIPQRAGGLEPLHAVYHQRAISAIEAQIGLGEMQIHRLVDRLVARRVTESEMRLYDPQLRSFTNVNTLEELNSIDPRLP